MDVIFKYHNENSRIQFLSLPILELVEAGDFDTLNEHAYELGRIVYFDDFADSLNKAFVMKAFGDVTEITSNDGVALKIPPSMKNLMTATYGYLAECGVSLFDETHDWSNVLAGAVRTGDVELLKWLYVSNRFLTEDARDAAFLSVFSNESPNSVFRPHPDALKWYVSNIPCDPVDYADLDNYAQAHGLTYIDAML